MRLRRFIIVILVIVVAVGVGVYLNQQAAAKNGSFVLSGTIEVTETNLPTLSGGQVKQVYVTEGDSIKKDQALVDVYSQTAQVNERITSPIDVIVFQRLVEPNEMAAPGSTVLVVAPLDQLYLKIFVPENLYRPITLVVTLPVKVDSFPGQTFVGKVSFISDKAEFTPRNVQTTGSPHTTAYAVNLNLEPTTATPQPGIP